MLILIERVVKFRKGRKLKPLAGASLTVRNDHTDTLATLYSTEGLALLNPVTTDRDGRASFCLKDPGLYMIRVEEPSIEPHVELVELVVKVEEIIYEL